MSHDHGSDRGILGAEGRLRFGIIATGLIFRGARNGFDQLTGLGIVLVDGILSVDRVAEVDEALRVDVHAVTLRRIDGTDGIAALIDMNHGRRSLATVGCGGSQAEMALGFDGVVRTIVDPDVVVFIDGQAGDAAHLPLIGQRLRPVGI